MAVDLLDLDDRERRLNEALGAYFEAVDAGRDPGLGTVLRDHPDLAEDLIEFFAEFDRFHRLAEPLRSATPTATVPGAEVPTEPLFELPAAPPVGRDGVFGDYVLLGEIGHGGMGVVYWARRRGIDRPVALKMILAGGTASDVEVRLFRAEAEAVAELDHPHIVPIYEVGRHRGCWFYSMRLVTGGNLADHLSRFTCDPRGSARLVAEIARAVHHAHQRGILHRDLKPSNVLLDPDGTPYLTDFGLARRIDGYADWSARHRDDGGASSLGGDPDLTESGAIVGSPPYMAPEQASGRKGATTTLSDVYGLGAILYTLLTGRLPFVGNTVRETLRRVRTQPLAPPSASNGQVDRGLEAICLKCLEKDPGRRYGVAEALAEDLERWLAGEPVSARSPAILDLSLIHI